MEERRGSVETVVAGEVEVREPPRPVQEAERPTRPWRLPSAAGDATDMGRDLRPSRGSPEPTMAALLTAFIPPLLDSNIPPLAAFMRAPEEGFKMAPLCELSIEPSLGFKMAAPQVGSILALELGLTVVPGLA